jgi:hypothetical protein
MADLEQRIRQRAYHLWEQAGRPHGQSDTFWLQARTEIEGDALPIGDRPCGEVDLPPEVTENDVRQRARPTMPPSEQNEAGPTEESGPAPASAKSKVRTARAAATPSARRAETPDDMAPGKPPRRIAPRRR